MVGVNVEISLPGTGSRGYLWRVPLASPALRLGVGFEPTNLEQFYRFCQTSDPFRRASDPLRTIGYMCEHFEL